MLDFIPWGLIFIDAYSVMYLNGAPYHLIKCTLFWPLSCVNSILDWIISLNWCLWRSLICIHQPSSASCISQQCHLLVLSDAFISFTLCGNILIKISFSNRLLFEHILSFHLTKNRLLATQYTNTKLYSKLKYKVWLSIVYNLWIG